MNTSVIQSEITSFDLSDAELLSFKQTFEGVEVAYRIEGSPFRILGRYKDGRWLFDDTKDRSLFLILMQQYPRKFQTYFKTYFRRKKKDGMFVTLSCARRRFSIYIQKLNGNFRSKLIDMLYPTRN